MISYTPDPPAQRIADSTRLDVIERLLKARVLGCTGSGFDLMRFDNGQLSVSLYPSLVALADAVLSGDCVTSVTFDRCDCEGLINDTFTVVPVAGA